MKGWQVLLAAAVGVFLTLVSSQSALAGRRPHAFTLSPLGGIYFFEGNDNLKNSSLFTLGVGYNFTKSWTGEILTSYIDTRSDLDDSNEIDGYLVRLDVEYHFLPESAIVPYVAAGFGGQWLDDPGGETDINAAFVYGGGIDYYFAEKIALRLDVRHLLVEDNLRFEERVDHQFVAQGGLIFQIGGELEPPPQVDTDGDGVVDAFDRCPGTRLGIPVDGFGCPNDADRDTVPDYLDTCPETPQGITVDRQGCSQDSDGDGVADYRDTCADTPPGRKVDDRGCLLPDSDADGIPDLDDRCPGTRLGVPVNTWGCPIDSDGDGVADMFDRCADTPPETAVDLTGCPQPGAPASLSAVDAINLRLEFDPGEAGIRPAFAAELQKAVDFIRSHPNRDIVVEGHTDSVGPEEANLELSRRRAGTIQDYLIGATAIDPSRITAVGYGESRPVADNSTQAGRLKNRRVVIRVQ